MGSSLWLAILSAPQAHPCSTVSDFGPCFCCVAQSLTQPWQPLHPLTGPRASTSSNLSLQMCFSSLGDLKREEYPNEEIYWTCKYLANCARRPQSVRLKVTLKPQDAFSLLLTTGCTIGVAQKYFRVLVCLFSLFNWKKKKKKPPLKNLLHIRLTWKAVGEKCHYNICYGNTLLYVQKGLGETWTEVCFLSAWSWGMSFILLTGITLQKTGHCEHEQANLMWQIYKGVQQEVNEEKSPLLKREADKK